MFKRCELYTSCGALTHLADKADKDKQHKSHSPVSAPVYMMITQDEV